MRNLLAAGGARLKKDKVFWLCMAFMFGLGIFVVYGKYRDVVRFDYGVFLDDAMMVYSLYVGVCAAVFCSLFLGTEYSDGTMRNKIIIGCDRSKIYASNLFWCVAATVLMGMAFLVSYCALGAVLLDPTALPAGVLASYIAISLLTIASFASIFAMVSMVVSKKSISAVLCLLLFFGMLMAAMVIDSRLSEPELTSGYTMTVNGIEETVPEPNPRYLQPDARKVYTFFYDLLPTCQGVQLSSHGVGRPWMMVGLSAAICVVTAAVGMAVFRRKDLK